MSGSFAHSDSGSSFWQAVTKPNPMCRGGPPPPKILPWGFLRLPQQRHQSLKDLVKRWGLRLGPTGLGAWHWPSSPLTTTSPVRVQAPNCHEGKLSVVQVGDKNQNFVTKTEQLLAVPRCWSFRPYLIPRQTEIFKRPWRHTVVFPQKGFNIFS